MNANRQALAADLRRTRAPFAAARTLPAAAYTDTDIFRLEQRALFATEWLCVGRAADLPAPGDYRVHELAGDSVVVVRGAEGSLHAFYNVCRHRGSRLLEEPAGRGLTRILCPYHSWSYGLDGRLLQAPLMGEGFDRSEHALNAVRAECHEGFVFVNLDGRAPPLARYLSDLPDLSRFRMGELVCARRIEYEVAANWKLICENYSECYHCTNAHPQLSRLSDLIARSDRAQEVGACFNGGPMRLRDGVATMSMSGRSSTPTIPGLDLEECRHVHYYVIYPNLLLSPHPDYVLTHTAWPIACGRTRVVCEWLFPQAAVADPRFDPADVVDFWDLTNRQDWALCERTQRGAQSRGFQPGPYQGSEDCVHLFDCWYAARLEPLLA